jgi:carboxypeptidase C (cathepsin A)
LLCFTLCLNPAGDQDLICNWLGNRRWVDGLEWSGAQGWSQAKNMPWKVAGQQVGEVANFETLTFVKVFGAVSGAGL